MGDLSLFLPILKVDEAQRLVYGIAADETPDSADEVFDYAKSKPHFEEWSKSIQQATDGKSVGNLRAQHDPKKAAGKLTDIAFNDASKAIEVAAKVVDDDAWQKVLEGVFTGFSIGGKYDERWRDGDFTRYSAVPFEISLVDLPANPSATFSVIKADGSTQEVGFIQERNSAMKEEAAKERTKRVDGEDLPESAFAYVGDPERTETWKLPIKFSTEEKTKSHIRNALARFDQTEGIPASERAKVKAKIVAAAHSHGIDVEEEKKEAAASLDAPTSVSGLAMVMALEKSMLRLTQLLEKTSNAHSLEGHDKRMSVHEHLRKIKEAHDAHHKAVGEAIDKAMLACAADGDEDEQEEADGAPEIQEHPASAKGISEADLQKALKQAFEAGIAATVNAIKEKSVAKGIGDRGRVVPAIVTPAPATEENDAQLARAYAMGDQEAGLKLMRKAKPSAAPEQAMRILAARR